MGRSPAANRVLLLCRLWAPCDITASCRRIRSQGSRMIIEADRTVTTLLLPVLIGKTGSTRARLFFDISQPKLESRPTQGIDCVKPSPALQSFPRSVIIPWRQDAVKVNPDDAAAVQMVMRME